MTKILVSSLLCALVGCGGAVEGVDQEEGSEEALCSGTGGTGATKLALVNFVPTATSSYVYTFMCPTASVQAQDAASHAVNLASDTTVSLLTGRGFMYYDATCTSSDCGTCPRITSLTIPHGQSSRAFRFRAIGPGEFYLGASIQTSTQSPTPCASSVTEKIYCYL